MPSQPAVRMPTAPPNVSVPLSHSDLSSSGTSVLHVYLPPPSTIHPFRVPLAVVILPGGSYRPGPFNWCKSAEGSDIAIWLSREVGVIASVLHYRLPAGKPSPPIEDLAEAIDLMRRGWVPPHRWSPPLVAVMGFSAGGHLAAMAATAARLDTLMSSPLLRSQRPDMALLMYPLICMSDANCTHANSQREFLGRDSTLELRQRYSAELRLSNVTPPTLLVHARDDTVVPLRGSVLYLQACRRHGVPCTLVELTSGGHPFVNKQRVWESARSAAIAWMRATASKLIEAHIPRGNHGGAWQWRPRPVSATIDDWVGARFPVSLKEAQGLRAELLGLNGVANVASTSLIFQKESHDKVLKKQAAPRLSAPKRPPPWVEETFDSPIAGDNLPYSSETS